MLRASTGAPDEGHGRAAGSSAEIVASAASTFCVAVWFSPPPAAAMFCTEARIAGLRLISEAPVVLDQKLYACVSVEAVTSPVKFIYPLNQTSGQSIELLLKIGDYNVPALDQALQLTAKRFELVLVSATLIPISLIDVPSGRSNEVVKVSSF